ncbi:NAD-dependent 4,6-dehydratase LegB [Maribellus sediminis]|uniref:NAD-dependent 4,6-dehydratase LegB n=1 Tax=Maribellus sediminis TaxID=2696285 RepID=UPI001431305F|nr:NAD-dependent 4,6-dehydratase LegB [Maribellus sediminis]
MNNNSQKLVLVTGADGFIGSHLVEELLSRNYRVRALALYNSFNDWGWLEYIPKNDNLEIVSGDVRDSNLCRNIVKGVDVIFNLAALIAIPYSYVAPDSYVDTNVKGALNICQAARDLGNIKVVQMSTSEVYGTAQYVPIDEKHPKQPQSPYSASKIGADAMAMSFYNAFNLPVVIARPFNTYGPRQSARAIIPTIITQIASGKKEIMLGDLTPTRDLNFVTDTCNGLIALSESEQAVGKEVNLSSNFEISMGDTLNMIKEIMGSSVTFVTDKSRIRPGKSEVFRLWGDNTLLKELTGFQPTHSLEGGLKKTIEWFSLHENLNKYKTDIYNV